MAGTRNNGNTTAAEDAEMRNGIQQQYNNYIRWVEHYIFKCLAWE